jgi:hypothetical protein
MAKFFSEPNSKHQDFIAAQKIFFVATAPTTGRVNLSPKGLDTFRCGSETPKFDRLSYNGGTRARGAQASVSSVPGA